MEARGFLWRTEHVEDMLGKREEDDGRPFDGVILYVEPPRDPEEVAAELLDERKVSPDTDVLTMDVVTLKELLTTAARRGSKR